MKTARLIIAIALLTAVGLYRLGPALDDGTENGPPPGMFLVPLGPEIRVNGVPREGSLWMSPNKIYLIQIGDGPEFDWSPAAGGDNHLP